MFLPTEWYAAPCFAHVDFDIDSIVFAQYMIERLYVYRYFYSHSFDGFGNNFELNTMFKLQCSSMFVIWALLCFDLIWLDY